MKVFVWERIDQATCAYHPEGGLVVFAETEERARELADKEYGCKLSAEELPDEVRSVEDGPERVFIFPDAGCC